MVYSDVESIASRIKIEGNFNLIINNKHLFNSNMRIGTYLDQVKVII